MTTHSGDLRESAITVIRASKVAVLSTISGTEGSDTGYPESRALLNLANPDQYPSLKDRLLVEEGPLVLWFSTNTSSSKVRQVAKNQHVGLYYCIPEEFKGLWIQGDMEIVKDPVEKERLWVEGWEKYYPKGKTDDDYCLLKLVARRMRLYRSLSVTDLAGDGRPV